MKQSQKRSKKRQKFVQCAVLAIQPVLAQSDWQGAHSEQRAGPVPFDTPQAGEKLTDFQLIGRWQERPWVLGTAPWDPEVIYFL